MVHHASLQQHATTTTSTSSFIMMHGFQPPNRLVQFVKIVISDLPKASWSVHWSHHPRACDPNALLYGFLRRLNDESWAVLSSDPPKKQTPKIHVWLNKNTEQHGTIHKNNPKHQVFEILWYVYSDDRLKRLSSTRVAPGNESPLGVEIQVGNPIVNNKSHDFCTYPKSQESVLLLLSISSVVSFFLLCSCHFHKAKSHASLQNWLLPRPNDFVVRCHGVWCDQPKQTLLVNPPQRPTLAQWNNFF